jgi:hypothetical protein
MGLGLVVAVACGYSNKIADNCEQAGGVCVHSGAACGDTLPFECGSGGQCCSTAPATQSGGAPSPAPTSAPTAAPATDAGH